MNKQELETRIDVHEKTIEIARERIKDLQSQLPEAEKPKLMHGDWWRTGGGIHIFLEEFKSKRKCVAVNRCLITDIGSDYHGEPIGGNVFKHIAALKALEPLENRRFKVEGKRNDEIFYAQVEQREDEKICSLQITSNWFHASADELDEIILKLRCLKAEIDKG